MNTSGALVSRYAIDLILILFFIWWCARKKRRRKRFLNRKVLFRVAVLFFSVYIAIPRLFGPIFPRIRYLPQFIEAHKLRLYYTGWAAVIPGKKASQATIEREIVGAARKYGLHPALIKAVVKVESSFNQFALSPTGGCGLMQLLPSTYYSLRGGNPFGVRSNLLAGTKYLRQLYNRYGGNRVLALAAYNAGPSNVKRYKGVPPVAETRGYVKRVEKYYEIYKKGS